MSTKYYNLSLEEVVHAVREGKVSCETVKKEWGGG